MKALRENLETTFTGNNDPNGSNRPKKKKRKSKQIWINEQKKMKSNPGANAYPNLVAHGSYGGGKMFSADRNVCADVRPIVKRREWRRQ